MITRPISLCILVNLLAAGAAHAQAVNLTEAPLKDACVRNELTMALEGKITVKKDAFLPLRATGTHEYVERFLETTGAVSDKAARVYAKAESVITFNNDAGPKRTLRPDRARLMVAHRHNDHVVNYSPHGSLTRDEADITEHLDTQAIPGLLPGKMTNVKESWTVGNSVVASLCDFDGLTAHKLTGTLVSVNGNLAQITIQGNAQGINLGAQVAVLIDAKLEFDIKAQRIVALNWSEINERHQGPITPTLSAKVIVKLKRTPIETPADLSDNALVKVPAGRTPPAEMTAIEHKSARYAVNYARDWHVTSGVGSPHLVMRYLERGQFVGQATVARPYPKTDVDKVMPLAAFANEMRMTPGWNQTVELESQQLPNNPKTQHTVYRVAAKGDLDGVPTTQFFYLIVGTNGEQVVVTFSVDPQQVQRLGTRDLELIREIEFAEPK